MRMDRPSSARRNVSPRYTTHMTHFLQYRTKDEKGMFTVRRVFSTDGQAKVKLTFVNALEYRQLKLKPFEEITQIEL